MFLGILIMNTFWLDSLFLLHFHWQETGGINCLLTPFNTTFTIIFLETLIYNISRTLYICNKNSIEYFSVLYVTYLYISLNQNFPFFIRPQKKIK